MLVCVFLMHSLRTRPRVQRAPGLPCALLFRKQEFMQTSSAIAPRDREPYSTLSGRYLSAVLNDEGGSSIPETSMIESISRRTGYPPSRVRQFHEGSALRSAQRFDQPSMRHRRPDFLAKASPPVSAIADTATTRSTIAWTSLRSHCPSDSFASRSFSRIVWWDIASAKCRPQ